MDRDLQDDGVQHYSSPTYLSLIKSPFLYPYQHSSTGEVTKDYADGDDFSIGNPSAILKYSINTSQQYRFNIGGKPTLQLTPDFKLSTQFDVSLDKSKEYYFSPMLGRASIEFDNGKTGENVAANQFAKSVTLYDDTQLAFIKQKNGHSVNAIAGFRIFKNTYEVDYIHGFNTGSDDDPHVGSDLDPLTLDGENNTSKTISNYFNVDYTFKDRYMLSLSSSMDASSKLGLNYDGDFDFMGVQWSVFPSVNAGWLVSSEAFMKKLNFISYLKLRAGYGISGNDDVIDYANRTYFKTHQYISFITGAVLDNLANESITWETTSRVNGGVDLNLFNDRIAFAFDVYKSKTTDLLTLKNLPDVSGLDQYWGNGGELENQGFEFSTYIKLLNLKSFQWEVGANIGHYQNEITAFDKTENTTAYGANIVSMVGQAAGVFYGYKTNGVYATEAQALADGLSVVNADGSLSNFGAGDVIFVNSDNSGQVRM